MKTAKEVLTKYSDGDYTQFQGYENILMAMDEYAKQYHESRMKEELINAFNWLSDKNSPYVPLYDEYNEKEIRFVTNEADFTTEQVVNSYLATRKNK
jgi:hypothetical protein